MKRTQALIFWKQVLKAHDSLAPNQISIHNNKGGEDNYSIKVKADNLDIPIIRNLANRFGLTVQEELDSIEISGQTINDFLEQ